MSKFEQVNNRTAERVPLSEVGQLWSTYLYNHPEVRERVETLSKKQGLHSMNHEINEIANSNMNVLLMAKYKRIKMLEAEVNRTKMQLKCLGGEIYNDI